MGWMMLFRVLVIAVGTREKIDRVVLRIDEMMGGGMITIETTTVHRYARRQDRTR